MLGGSWPWFEGCVQEKSLVPLGTADSEQRQLWACPRELSHPFGKPQGVLCPWLSLVRVERGGAVVHTSVHVTYTSQGSTDPA